MATKNGYVKKTDLMEYDSIRKGGLAVRHLERGRRTDRRKAYGRFQGYNPGDQEGMSIRFEENDVRPLGRVSQGVKGISLEEGDYVIGMGAPYLIQPC